ncbi:MAG: ArsR family transcriptional regulator [Candidatus Dadabacteria bacterium]|nr:MAG: ArsR family transcriptional regulator [Candidatus Dadabacteria bacterium]
MKKRDLSKLKQACTLLRLLSHPVRLAVFCALAEGEQNVTNLYKTLGVSQVVMSQHLAKLRDSGYLQVRREGQKIYYRIAKKEVKALIEALYGIYCKK